MGLGFWGILYYKKTSEAQNKTYLGPYSSQVTNPSDFGHLLADKVARQRGVSAGRKTEEVSACKPKQQPAP